MNHTGLFPSVTVSFNLAPGVSLGQATSEIDRIQQKLGMPQSVHGEFSGTLQAFQQSLTTEPYLVLTAMLAVYLVLGILYESLVHPITILSTLPPASVGAILALLLTQSELDVMSITGIILLIGIVKKNAIMMIDFALNAERNEGKNTRDSIFEASMLRFRPIMMTTMAALFGAVPLAVGTGMGSELRRPLGISIIGGLMVSQALTLYTTPVIYLFMDKLRLKLQGERAREHAGGRTGRMRNTETRKNALRSRRRLGICMALLAGCNVGPKYTHARHSRAAGLSRSRPRRHTVGACRAPGSRPSRRMPRSRANGGRCSTSRN